MYLVWFEPASSRAEIADVVLGRLAGPLLGLGPLRLSVDVWDPASDIPAPVPTPEGETPLHAVVSVWLDAVDHRAPYEELLWTAATRLAGYSVVDTQDLGSAVALAKACPNLRVGGGVEVGALAELPTEHTAEVLRSRQRSA